VPFRHNGGHSFVSTLSSPTMSQAREACVGTGAARWTKASLFGDWVDVGSGELL
jgi:hypothetical protein